MEIIHTTYEQAHGGGRTTSSPAQSRPQPERKHEEKKKTQKLNDRNSDPSSSSRSQQKIPRKAVPVKKPDIRLRDEKGALSYPVPIPDLRRTGGFYDVSRKEENGKGKERDSQEMNRQESSINFSSATSSPFYAHRLGYQAPQMREIPRSTPKQPPSRPINTNTILLSPRNEYKTRSMETPVTPWPTVFKHQNQQQQKHQKSKSTSNKFVEYIRNSADLFDDARREMTGKLSPALGSLDQLPLPNHINFSLSVNSDPGTESGPSSTRGAQRTSKTKAKSKRNSADSIASFYCAGDSHLEDKGNHPPTSNTKDALQLPNNKTRKPQYFSPSPGTIEKLTSSTDVEPRLCRLCNKHPEGIMGLCRQCEEDFTRPNSWTPAEKTQESSLDMRIEEKNPTPPPTDEIKPTPPLKILKTSSTTPQSPQSLSTISTSPSPILNHTPGPKLGFVGGGKTVINPATLSCRQNSHHVVIVDADDEEDTRYSRYQSETMRMDAERTREDLMTWARGYGSEIDCHPQKARKRWRDGVQRNTRFYGFYDEILDR